MPISEERIAAWRRGRRAETLAALLLRLKGYRVLDRRFRVPAGEVDLIVRRGDIIAFVEVKARATRADAAEAISPHQRRRIAAAAAAWLGRRGDLAGCDVRFDAVLVAPRLLPQHLADCWRPD
jgi:putative endonuclease